MTVADTPSLDVENSPAGAACCKTCSKDHVAHGNGGVFYFVSTHFLAESDGGPAVFSPGYRRQGMTNDETIMTKEAPSSNEQYGLASRSLGNSLVIMV